MHPLPRTVILERLGCPKSFEELVDTIVASGATRVRTFESLRAAVERWPDFFDRCLPFIHASAVENRNGLPDPIPSLDERGSVTLTQQQCLCILANAFFCTFRERTSNNCVSPEGLPSINFDEMYGGPTGASPEAEKLLMLFCYFDACCRRITAGAKLDRWLRFERHGASASESGDWSRCNAALTTPQVYELGRSLDSAVGMLRVDFANRIIGGAAIAHGCVQEEIMFCEHPELIVSRLLCRPMDDDEAIVVAGAERFSTHVGYAQSLAFSGPHEEQHALASDGMLASWVVAIDAKPFGRNDVAAEFTPPLILRELTKAWAGFDQPHAPAAVATGNWGCGVFGGDVRLKSVIQWIAASRAGKQLHYYPWDSSIVAERFHDICAQLVSQRRTVGQVAQFLFEGLRPGDVYEQLYRWGGEA